MAITFPSSPSTNDTFTVNGRTYVWDGTAWKRVNAEIASVVPSLEVTGDFTGDTDTLYVDSTNDRVGVGTTTPSEELDVVGDIQVSGRLGIGSGISAELDIKGASNPEIRLQSTDSSDPFLYFGDQVDAVRGGIGMDTSANALQLRGYNNSTRMTIDSSGNVGIGTTSPRGVLDVNSQEDVYLTSNTSQQGVQDTYMGGHVYFTPFGSGDTVYLQARRGDSSGNTEMILRTSNSGAVSDNLKIDHVGRVTTPNQPAFAVYQTGSADVAYSNIANMTNALTNVGNHFNLSTDRFTAPVAGLYCFLWSAYTNTTTSSQRSAFYVNGTVALQNGSAGYSHNTLCAVFPLAANDYVQFGGVNGSFSTHFYGSYGHNQFSGWLIG